MIEKSLTETFIIGLLAGMVRMAAPILATAVGGIITERSGILNLGLEGIMIIGAFVGFVGAYFSENLWVGVLCSMVGGGMIATVHAFISITMRGNQTISGLAIAMLGGGLTLFLFRAIFGVTIVQPRVNGFQPLDAPVFSSIPIIGPIIFKQNVLVYIIFVSTLLSSYLLYRTSFGLKVRGVGENPAAADALGVNVNVTRYLCVALGGAFSGLGGAFLTLGHLNMYVDNITGGRGWIALALVIFGKWDPVKALWGALLFGFVDASQLRIQGLGIELPTQLLSMLPYMITVVVLVGVMRRAERPGALAQPYQRGQA